MMAPDNVVVPVELAVVVMASRAIAALVVLGGGRDRGERQGRGKGNEYRPHGASEVSSDAAILLTPG